MQSTKFSGRPCPEFDCSDVVPEFPTKSLRDQLTELENIRHKGAKGQPYILSALICLSIKRERQIPALKLLGERSKWPSIINFKLLSDRVFSGLRQKLNGMVQGHVVLSSSTPWTLFSTMLKTANTSLLQFSRASDAVKYEIAGTNKHAG
jgi:hypothetical protein